MYTDETFKHLVCIVLSTIYLLWPCHCIFIPFWKFYETTEIGENIVCIEIRIDRYVAGAIIHYREISVMCKESVGILLM